MQWQKKALEEGIWWGKPGKQAHVAVGKYTALLRASLTGSLKHQHKTELEEQRSNACANSRGEAYTSQRAQASPESHSGLYMELQSRWTHRSKDKEYEQRNP